MAFARLDDKPDATNTKVAAWLATKEQRL